jgi:hypothetical protein
MGVFRKQARLAFEREMLAHLREFSPPLFRAVGEGPMLRAIQLGIDAAATYGLTFRGPVRLYLELMLLFGSSFDTDPQYPWAAAILADGKRETQMDRANALYKKTLDYRREVVGYDDVYAMAAYRRLGPQSEQPVTSALDEVDASLLREMKQVYPEKAAYVGDDSLGALITTGREEGRKHGLSTVRGIRVAVALMLFLGHGCLDDVLYPWIAHTLRNDNIADPDERASHLQRRALVWIDHVLVSLRKGAQA